MCKILVVEDNRQWLDIISTMLTNNGYHCIPATSVKQAITCLGRYSSLKLALLDIVLCRESGFDLLRHMRRFIKYRHLPIIMCSMMKEREAVIQSVRLGAQDYILKPVKEDLLLAKIKAVIDADKGIVLVVSDNHIQINLLSKILIRSGYLVASANCMGDAIKILHGDPLIKIGITDLVLARGDGLSLLVEVKAKWDHIPVLVVRERPGKADYENIIASGADGIIRLPFTSTDIAKIIENCLPAFQQKNMRKTTT